MSTAIEASKSSLSERAATAHEVTEGLPPPELRGLRGLAHLLSTQRALLALAATGSALAVGLALVPFFCVARMASALFAVPPRLEDVRTLALVACGAVVFRYALSSMAHAVAHVAAFRLLHDLRLRLARKLGDVPLSFFSERRTGDIKRTMMDDVNQIESFVAHHFPDGVGAFTVPFLLAIVLFALDWRMTLASIAVAPLAMGMMSVTMRGRQDAHRQWLEIQDRTNHSLLEFLRGIHVIKTFGLTATNFGDLKRSIEENGLWIGDYMRQNGKAYGMFHVLIGASAIFLLPLGGYLHLTHRLSLENLVLFLVLGPQLVMGGMKLMFAWGNVQRIDAGNARILAVLQSPSLVTGRASRSAPAGHTIAFSDVGFHYVSGKDALAGVSFEAKAGEVTAIVGPSGAGKTTIARLIPRFWDATRGRITLGGVDVKEIALDELLASVSLIFQDVFLFHGTVRENLRLAKPDATDDELVAACRAARAHDFVQALPRGYDTPIGERGARLSGGEKQRLSIARALLKNAPVLVLDEATAFADAENETHIQRALSEVCQGRTVVVIAHRLATIAGADRIVVLEHGAVVDQGRHDELLGRCTLYETLWRNQRDAAGWAVGQEPAQVTP